MSPYRHWEQGYSCYPIFLEPDPHRKMSLTELRFRLS